MPPEASSPWKGLLYLPKPKSHYAKKKKMRSLNLFSDLVLGDWILFHSLGCFSALWISQPADIPGHVGVDDSVYPARRLLTVSIPPHIAFMCAVIKCSTIWDTVLLHLPLLLTSVSRKVQESLWQLEKSAGCNCDVSTIFWTWTNSRSQKSIHKSDWIFCPLFTLLETYCKYPILTLTVNNTQIQILNQFRLFWQHKQS